MFGSGAQKNGGGGYTKKNFYILPQNEGKRNLKESRTPGTESKGRLRKLFGELTVLFHFQAQIFTGNRVVLGGGGKTKSFLSKKAKEKGKRRRVVI